jgi:PAS domain S-box-containing protein
MNCKEDSLNSLTVATSNIKFSDIFVLEDIQRIQDMFSDATNVASIITHPDGTPITNPSNFCKFCNNIRKTEQGLANCYKSDAILGFYNPSGPVVQKCQSGGLWEAGASITVGGIHIANWLIGQVRDEESAESQILQYADIIGANREDFISAFRKVPVMSFDQFKKVSDMLFEFANQLSQKAFSNFQLKIRITEHEQTIALLKESEERFQLLFDEAPLGYQSLDFDGYFIQVNQKWIDTLGYARHEVIGKWFGDFLSKEYREGFRERFPIFKAQGRIHSEFEMVHKNGSKLFIAFAGRIGYDPDGNFKQTHCIIQDITDRRKTERELRENREKYRLLTENIKDVVWILDVESMHFRYVSPSVVRLRGYSPEEIMAEHFKCAFTEDAAEKFVNLTRSRAKAVLSDNDNPGIYFTDEVEQPCKDGSTVWTEVIASYYLNPENGKVEVRGVSRDISDRKRTEMILKESEEKFRNLVETTNDVIWETNMKGLFTYTSPQIENILGYKPNEFVGHSPFEFMPEGEVEKIRKRSNEIVASRKSFSGLININLHKDGRKIIIETSGVPVFDSNNNLTGYRGIDRDISERRKAEDEILLLNTELENRVKQRTLQLENANKELDAFSYSVSHNLRSPLRGIDGWSLALLEDYNQLLDEQGRTYLARVRSEAQQMASLIDDLLKLSRVTRVELQQENVNLTGLVQTIANQFVLTNPKRKFEFIIEPGVVSSGDLSMLQIVLTNLLGNACKFTGLKPIAIIEFGKLEIEGKAAYFIRDNGVGFNMEHSKKLFEAFHRMHKTTDFPGSGVGLATVHRIISRHGGRIWAESKEGEGATFYFTIN